ncbi:hypothetical protein P3T76_006486 [Phytophthora citrophthora]|uniref:PiggyBac transposable element-derived protein domain-containing protein n=1 Tax=Phytophthora citrophthora TaxID=4793 RepID=A0AAD9GNP9_9STRA|nr:hypothetical protein P3T76_006486 [Phytophthora citrophthora]
MNGVDRVDQLRATNPTRRKEKWLSVRLFTWMLDLCIIIIAFTLFNNVLPVGTQKVALHKLQRRIAEQVTAKQLAKTQTLRPERKSRGSAMTNAVGSIRSGHILTPNSTETSDGQLKCMLCNIRGLQRRSRYGCTGKKPL